MSSKNGGGDGPDPVDLASNIGTWVAAVVAIIALVGVVAPFIALQASLSDNNRAMNAVQDRPQKYISRGYRLTKGLRVLRRVRVPNLSPGYITNEPDDRPLVPMSAALGHFVIRARDYLPWNTGWAKLAELIDAYDSYSSSSNDPLSLGVSNEGGTLEVVNGRTALVVNKHWILLLGLLGRYGRRSDKGVLQKTGIRRDFNGERGSIRYFDLPRKDKRPKSTSGGIFDKLKRADDRMIVPVMEHVRRGSTGYSIESDSDPASDVSQDEKDTISLRRSAYGEWTLGKKAQPTIHGVTGTVKMLGRHKGSWSYLTSVSFVPHTSREIFAATKQEKREVSSMQTLFWLSHGFLPAGRTSEGRQIVISLEGPEVESDNGSYSGSDVSDDESSLCQHFSLQESDDIPISIGNAMKFLGIPEPMVLQFLPAGGLVHDEPETREQGDTGGLYIEKNSGHDDEVVDIRGKWLCCSQSRDGTRLKFLRHEMQRALSIILSLEWDEWGFLIWRDRFWASVLKSAIEILKRERIGRPTFAESLGFRPHHPAAKHRVTSQFQQKKLTDYLDFDETSSSLLKGSDILPLRLALGTLYIVDPAFRIAIARSCERLRKPEMSDAEKRNLEERKEEIKTRLKEVETRYLKQKEDNAGVEELPPPQFLGDDTGRRPTYTRLLQDHVDYESLQALKIDYTYETNWPGAPFLVKRWLPEWEQDYVFDHSRMRRDLAAMDAEMKVARVGTLEFDHQSKQLTWYKDETRETSQSWTVNVDLKQTPGNNKIVRLTEEDMVLVGLWTANRAAMWLSSQDSKPLLSFMDELDPFVYVL